MVNNSRRDWWPQARARGTALRFPRVLVTGATGFLGQPLVERLVSDGYSVTAVGRRREKGPPGLAVDYLVGDLAEHSAGTALLTPWRWDAVVNAAGPVPQGDSGWDDGHTLTRAHVSIALTVCLAVPPPWTGRLIHVSSMTVYGLPQYLPVDEGHPRMPLNCYGIAKALAEDVFMTVGERHGFDCWILRLPGLFCETRSTGALFDFMRAAAEGRPLVVSAARPTPWDVLRLSDAVEAIARALTADERAPGAVNVSYGQPVELAAIAAYVAQRFGGGVPVEHRHQVQHPVFHMAIGKARRLLNWPPSTLDAQLQDLWTALGSRPAVSERGR